MHLVRLHSCVTIRLNQVYSYSYSYSSFFLLFSPLSLSHLFPHLSSIFLSSSSSSFFSPASRQPFIPGRTEPRQFTYYFLPSRLETFQHKCPFFSFLYVLGSLKGSRSLFLVVYLPCTSLFVSLQHGLALLLVPYYIFSSSSRSRRIWCQG